MPNGVKYSTTTPSGSLRKDNVALGVNGNLGPTANTGFYSMPAPASGKYIINKVAASGLPNFFAPQNDTELIQLARNEGATGDNTGSAAAVLSWIATQPNLEAANFEYEGIVTDGLVLNVDAGFVGSYPTTGTTWYDLSGNNYTGTLINGPTFNSANSGSIVFDGTNDYCQLSQNIFNTSYPGVTFGAWVYLNGNIGGALIAGVWNQSANGDQAALFIFSNGPFIAVSDGVTGEGGTGASNTLNVSQWYYIAASWNSNRTYKYYQNGSLLGTGTQGGNGWNSSSTANFEIGAENQANIRYFNGRIACSQVYNRTLSDSEVLQNYNAQKSRFGL
jgi:hypothetical protein